MSRNVFVWSLDLGAFNHFDGRRLEVVALPSGPIYLEIAGAGGGARLVILTGEVGGRWLPETANFLRALAVPPLVEHAAARAIADSLLEMRGVGGAGGDAPSSHDVVWDNRF